MTETEIINNYLIKEAETPLEKNLKFKCIDLYSKFSSLGQEVQTLKQNLQNKELDFFKTKTELESLYSLIIETEKGK